ncbi:AGC protein kinase, partial [Puccinia sorghi]
MSCLVGRTAMKSIGGLSEQCCQSLILLFYVSSPHKHAHTNKHRLTRSQLCHASLGSSPSQIRNVNWFDVLLVRGSRDNIQVRSWTMTPKPVCALLQRNPAVRMTGERIKKHPYFGMIDWDQLTHVLLVYLHSVQHKRYIPPYVSAVNPNNATDTQNFDETLLAMEPTYVQDDDPPHPGAEEKKKDVNEEEAVEDGGNAEEGARMIEPPGAVDKTGHDVFDGYSYLAPSHKRDSIILEDEEDKSLGGDDSGADAEANTKLGFESNDPTSSPSHSPSKDKLPSSQPTTTIIVNESEEPCQSASNNEDDADKEWDVVVTPENVLLVLWSYTIQLLMLTLHFKTDTLTILDNIPTLTWRKFLTKLRSGEGGMMPSAWSSDWLYDQHTTPLQRKNLVIQDQLDKVIQSKMEVLLADWDTEKPISGMLKPDIAMNSINNFQTQVQQRRRSTLNTSTTTAIMWRKKSQILRLLGPHFLGFGLHSASF